MVATVRPLRRRELIALDCAIALCLSLGYLLVASEQAKGWTAVLPLDVAYGLSALTGALVAVRRIWPIPVFLLAIPLATTVLLLGGLRAPLVALALTCYTATANRRILGPRGWAVLAGVSIPLVGFLLCAGIAGPMAAQIANAVLELATLSVGWSVGATAYERRAYRILEQRERTARAVADERLRIAREVHDIVAGNLGTIAVKASVARYVAQQRPEEAGAALESIERISRSALREMRQVLQLLRTDPRDLNAAVELGRQAGLRVEARIVGTEYLPAQVAASTYRILQESLTNVRKHAGEVECRVVVEGTLDQVRIEVCNVAGGRPLSVPGPGTGNGLAGMRERAARYGGSFEAGPQPDGGFRVLVTLPYPLSETESDSYG